MKKFRIFCISLLVLFSAVLFSACNKSENILTEEMTLSDDYLLLGLGESFDVDVTFSPDNVTNKKFEAFGYNQDVVSVEVDCENGKLKVTATSQIVDSVADTFIGVRALDDSKKEGSIAVHVTDNTEPVDMPRHLNFDGEIISWDVVPRAISYTISINGEKHIVPTDDELEGNTMSFSLNIDKYEGKNVAVKVKSNGESRNLDSQYTSELQFYIFNKPTNAKLNFSVDEQTDKEIKTLTWDRVDGANSYRVEIGMPNPDYPQHSNQQIMWLAKSGITSNSIDVTNDLENANNYKIRLKTETNLQNTKFASNYSETIEVSKLGVPENVRVINGVLQWDTVRGAVEYKVTYTFKKNGRLSKVTQSAPRTTYKLPVDMDPGEYTAKVSAIGNGTTSISGEYSSDITYRKLEKVQNVRLENGVIYWDITPFASSYKVTFENIVDTDGQISSVFVSQTGDAESVSFDEISTYPAGDYQINIQSVGTVGTVASDVMDSAFVVSKLSSPINFHVVKVDGKSMVQWDKVEKAISYMLTVSDNGAEEVTYQIPQSESNFVTYEFPENIIKVGTNTVSIKSLGSNQGEVNYINSALANITITKLPTPELNTTNIKNGILSWKLISETSGYEVLVKTESGELAKDPIQKTVTNIDFNSAQYALAPGGYQVLVRALASANRNLFDSDYTEVLNVYKCDVQNIYVNNGSVNDLVETEDYAYEYVVTKQNGASLTLSSIKSYVDSTIESNAVVSIQVRVLPKMTGDIHYIGSDLSPKIYVKKLPTVQDIRIVDGILYYGAEYASLNSFNFKLNLDEQEIYNSSNTTYDFNIAAVGAGTHTVSICAISDEGEGVFSEDADRPSNLNSKISITKSFTKVETPSNLRISSFAADYSNMIGLTIASLTSYKFNRSGSIVWDGVQSARSYELLFSNGTKITTSELCESLQNQNIPANQQLTVKIRALGNGTDIISSPYTSESVTFTKLYSPNSITVIKNDVGEKIVKWTYASGQDPNSDFSMFTVTSSNLKMAFHVFVDSKFVETNGREGNMFNAIDMETYSDDMITGVKTYQCKLPNNIASSTSLRVLAVPFNSYISQLNNPLMTSNISATNENIRYVVADYSPEVNIECLQTPTGLKMENNIIEWSPLLYNNNDKALEALNEYQLEFAYGENNSQSYTFSVKKKGTSASALYPTIYVESLTDSAYLHWEFNKANFESLFGSNTYQPNVYSVSIKAISNNVNYSVGNRTVYYADSKKSSGVSIEILSSPIVSLARGILVWNDVANMENYELFIQKSGQAEIFEETINNYFVLNEDYEPGQYTFEVISVGDGVNTITSERQASHKRTFTKLEKVSGLKLFDGLVQYNNHAVVSLTSNYCEYGLYIRSENQANDSLYFNDKYNTFELEDENKFVGGERYYIRVMAIGDNSKYISSDLSSYCYIDDYETLPTKLESPTNLKIVNGQIEWDRASGITTYLIDVSGGEYQITKKNNSYDMSGIPSGIYNVKVKAVGNLAYLNSSSAIIRNVKKLKDLQNFAIENGYIVWDCDSVKNYKLVTKNGEELQVTDLNEDNLIEQSGQMRYRLLGFDTNDTQLYFFNYGDNIAVSSEPTNILTFKKLSIPTNLSIDSETFVFSPVQNANNYAIKIEISLSNNMTYSYVYLPSSISTYTTYSKDASKLSIPFNTIQESAVESLGISVTQINGYKISMSAIGDTISNLDASLTYYVTSDDSEEVEINQPATPLLEIATDRTNRFYGKVVWNAVEGADYYKLFVKAQDMSHAVLFNTDISEAKTDDISSHSGYYYYIVSGKTYANVQYMDDSYSFFVVACKNKDGFDSGNSNVLSNLTYNLFGDEQDGYLTPYQISTETEFNAIKFNLEASYVLMNDLELEYVPQVLGNETNYFNGTFDGANHVIKGVEGDGLFVPSSNRTFNGLFGIIGENGVVKNLTFNANVSATTIAESAVQVSLIATKNYGTIQNVVVLGSINTVYSSDTYMIYNAGITVYNYGLITECASNVNVNSTNNNNSVYAGGIAVFNQTGAIIEKSGFVNSASGQIVGGICAVNSGSIRECYFEGENANVSSSNNGISANYAGGIVGYMLSGEISYCYVYGVVYGTTSTSQIAYVGGFVGRLTSGRISNSYVIGYKNNSVIISAVGGELNTTKVGVVVGASDRSNFASNVVYQILENQKPISNSSSINGGEKVEASLEISIKNNIDNYASYFDLNSVFEYPTLINAKYL